jgi:hypothetical protein
LQPPAFEVSKKLPNRLFERSGTMPKALIETIDNHHGGLLRALDELEALVGGPTPGDEIAAAIGAVRRRLMAHELTAERFVVGPLRHLHLLDAGQLAALADELDQLVSDAASLTVAHPDPEAAIVFIRAARDHIDRKTRTVVPIARSALAQGRLPAVPAWYVEEVYGLQGSPGVRPPEEWLG